MPAHHQTNALRPLPGPWNQREFHSTSKVAETVIIHSVRKRTGKHLPVWRFFKFVKKNKTMDSAVRKFSKKGMVHHTASNL